LPRIRDPFREIPAPSVDQFQKNVDLAEAAREAEMERA